MSETLTERKELTQEELLQSQWMEHDLMLTSGEAYVRHLPTRLAGRMGMLSVYLDKNDQPARIETELNGTRDVTSVGTFTIDGWDGKWQRLSTPDNGQVVAEYLYHEPGKVRNYERSYLFTIYYA